MAKIVDNSVLDAALDKIATATSQVLCSSQPANYAGVAAVALATATMVAGNYTKSDGTVSGRKTTLAAKAGVSITTSGTATHTALHDGTTLLYVTTTPSQALVSGGTVDIGTWSVEIADPS